MRAERERVNSKALAAPERVQVLEGHPGRGRGRALSPLKGSPGSSSQTIKPHLKGKYIFQLSILHVGWRKININMNKNETFPSLWYYIYRRAKGSTRLDGCKACGMLPRTRLTCQRVSHLPGGATSWQNLPSRTKKSPKCTEAGWSRPARRLVLSRGSHVTEVRFSLIFLGVRSLLRRRSWHVAKEVEDGPACFPTEKVTRAGNERGRREGQPEHRRLMVRLDGGRASDARPRRPPGKYGFSTSSVEECHCRVITSSTSTCLPINVKHVCANASLPSTILENEECIYIKA